MAPAASIVYVGAPNNYQDLDAALNHIADQHWADIVTNSYGFASEFLPPGYIKPYNDTFIQAAAEGISVLVSSGDNADETNGVAEATPTPDWPASSPSVTAVGGTSLGVDQNNARVFELGWETRRQLLVNGAWAPSTWLYGSGGGTSRLFAQPAHQTGVVLGDPNTGMLIGQTQTFPDGSVLRVPHRRHQLVLAADGGHARAGRAAGGTAFGLANPRLYAAAGTSAYNDITKADLATYPGDVRSDYINSVDASNGYRYLRRMSRRRWGWRGAPCTGGSPSTAKAGRRH